MFFTCPGFVFATTWVWYITYTHTCLFLLSILSSSFCQSNDCSTSLALTLSCPDTIYYFLIQRKMVQAMHNFDLALLKRIRISRSCFFDVPSMQALWNANVSPQKVPFWITSRTHQIAHHFWIWPTTQSVSPTQLLQSLYYSSWICFPCFPLCCFSASASTSICNHFLARSLSHLPFQDWTAFCSSLTGHNWTWFGLNIVLSLDLYFPFLTVWSISLHFSIYPQKFFTNLT